MAGRNAAGGGSIRKRTVVRNGKDYTYWEARVTIGSDPGTGRQIQKSFTGKTQREVREKMNAAVSAVDDGTYHEPSKMRLKEWMDLWADTYLVDIKPLTIKAYKAVIKKHIAPNLGACRLDELHPHIIQKFYHQLGATLSAKSIRNIHGVLHKALQQAVKNGLLKSNPVDACSPPRVVRPEIQPIAGEQMPLLLDALRGDPYEIPLTVALFTGMREGELMGLSWECVDFAAGTVLVKQQLQSVDGTRQILSTKNGKSRLISPAPFVMDLLRKQKILQAEQRLAAGQYWTDTGLVFTNADGRSIARSTMIKHFKRAAAEIGFPKLRVHDLRHSYAVASLQAGDDIKTVQENLGHATAAFTLDVYGHVTDEMKRESAERMEKFIRNRVRVK